jgi:hypothetical protein
MTSVNGVHSRVNPFLACQHSVPVYQLCLLLQGHCHANSSMWGMQASVSDVGGNTAVAQPPVVCGQALYLHRSNATHG